MDSKRFNELLEQAKNRRVGNVAAISELQEKVTTTNAEVDLTSLGVPPGKEDDKLRIEAAAEIISDIHSMDAEIPEGRVLGVARDDIILNERQQEFLNTVFNQQDCVLIGAAGTGKTTSMRQTTMKLLEDENRLPPLKTGTKFLASGTPGGAILSYTRKAVNNIRHAVVGPLKANTLTIHKLLEFEPVFYEIPDPNNVNSFKTTMKFEPMRGPTNPLPSQLIFLAFEESSMIAVDLYKMLQDAMPHAHQEVFLGDIQQLPPIFGPAILGFKMVELPVIELTEIYRQAANSPIISLAHKLLAGDAQVFNPKVEKFKRPDGQVRNKVPALEALAGSNEDGTVVFNVWQKPINDHRVTIAMKTGLIYWIKNNYYHPFEDIILMPFNKNFGTIEVNKIVAQYMGEQREAVVHHIIAGFQDHYLAVGDRVLYDKEDAIITRIVRNTEYLGKRFAEPSIHLDRWGTMQAKRTEQEKLQADADNEAFELAAIDDYLENNIPSEERVHAASHVVHVQLTYADNEDDIDIPLSSSAEINNLLGGHAITVHKFQGSENDRVFLLLHQSHNVMISRELLYTAITRAKKWIHIQCENDTFWKGIRSQRVKGNTIQEKAEFFKGKKDASAKDEIEAPKHNSLPAPVVKDVPVTTTIRGQKAIKLSDLPSPKVKEEAEQSLIHYWNEAITQFGPGIGKIPSLSYGIRNPKTVGRANFLHGSIQLNPIWLAAAERDEEVYETMLIGTIIHEIAHIVAFRKYRDTGHGVYWRNCMKRMGRPVAGNDPAVELPNWFSAKQSLLTEILLSAEEKPTEELPDKNEVE